MNAKLGLTVMFGKLFLVYQLEDKSSAELLEISRLQYDVLKSKGIPDADLDIK